MLNGKSINSKAVIESIFRDYGFKPTSVDVEAIKEHIFDAMMLIGVPTAFHDEVDVIEIIDYRGDLPCGLIDLHPGMVRMHGTQRPLIYSTDRFYSTHSVPETQSSTPDINDPYYTAYSDAPTIMDKDTYFDYYVGNARTEPISLTNSGRYRTGTTDLNTQSTGVGGTHNNLQPYITLNYIIKA